MCYTCYTYDDMRTISHRELRNNSGEVLREVAAGETVAVTNRGEVVAHLTPPSGRTPGLRVAKPARARIDISRLSLVTLDEPSQVSLDELRADR